MLLCCIDSPEDEKDLVEMTAVESVHQSAQSPIAKVLTYQTIA